MLNIITVINSRLVVDLGYELDDTEIASHHRCSCSFLTNLHQEFVSEAESEMKSLLKLYSHMKQEYVKVVKFFGEDSAKMRIDEFFSTFASFIEDFKVSLLCTIVSVCLSIIVMCVCLCIGVGTRGAMGAMAPTTIMVTLIY